MAVLYIVILIGVLVFVHEFGHFIAARIFHVRVEHFSIGFGPKLCSIMRGDTEWEIRLLPLGGYVQMAGTDFEEITDPDDPDYASAYNNKPIWQKAIINLAGPLFNLLLPIPILFAVYFGTVTESLPASIGQVLDNAPAIEKLEPGDIVTRIDDEPIQYWGQLHDIIADNPDVPLQFEVQRDQETLHVEIVPQETVIRDAMDILDEKIGRIGITPDLAPAIIGITSEASAAAQSGLQTFDEIAAVNGVPVSSYVELERQVRHHSGVLELLVLRPQKIDVPYGNVSVLNPVKITINTTETHLQNLGIASVNMYLTDVDENSPASKAGLQVGDRILEIDGASINVFRSFLDKLMLTWEQPHELTVQRADRIFKTQIQLEKQFIVGEFQEELPIIYSGFYHRAPIVSPELVSMPIADRLLYAVKQSCTVTVNASTLLAVSIVRMAQGRVSTKSLGGPIMIGHMAAKAGEEGIDMFLRMLAIISINLGILNLIPIPLFDGGKLVILLVEAVKRGPISMRTRQIIAYIGLALVLMLLMLAFKNDLERMWNLFFS